MLKLKFAVAFLIVLAVFIHQTQGKSILDEKDKDEKDSTISKIKFEAIKKLKLLKAIASAPFIIGKKAAILKIGAVKSLALLKALKAKKVLGLASKKVVDKVSEKVDMIKKVPEVLSAIPEAVASIPKAAAAAAAAAASVVLPAIKPETYISKPKIQKTEVLYTLSDKPAPIVVDKFSVGLNPAEEINNSYQYYSVPEAHYGVHVESQDTDTDVVVPHVNYGVPNFD